MRPHLTPSKKPEGGSFILCQLTSQCEAYLLRCSSLTLCGATPQVALLMQCTMPVIRTRFERATLCKPLMIGWVEALRQLAGWDPECTCSWAAPRPLATWTRTSGAAGRRDRSQCGRRAAHLASGTRGRLA